MAYLVRWWLAAEVIGLFALPLCFRIFQRLPDRGYAFARIFGLLLIGYVLWIGGTAGLLPFSAGTAVLVAGGLGIAAVPLFLRDRTEILLWLRTSRGYVIAVEAVFLGALLLIAFLRSYAPEIAATEKPFEYANYQAVQRAEYFAPTDPWYAGKPMPYYYLGYEITGAVAKLTGTPSQYAFNIALALTGALAALAAFGLAANVAAVLRSLRRIAGRWPLAAGLLAVLLLIVIGNLAGLLELGAVHGWNPQWVYQHLDIKGLQARSSAHWYPDDGFFSSAWRPTRLGSDWNFLEFPSFSFLLGDLHPHVLALPFKLLAAGFALALVLATESPHPRRLADQSGEGARPSWLSWSWNGALLWCSAALAAGALLPIHTWDYPPFILLMVLAVVGAVGLTGRRAWGRAAVSAVGLVLLSLLVALPFYFSTGSGSVKGIQPTLVAFRDPIVNAEGSYLPFQHLLIFWTPLMLPATFFVLWCIAQRRWKAVGRHGGNALGLVALLPLAWVFSVFARHGAAGLRQEIQIRGWGWLTVLTLGALLWAALTALTAELRDAEDGERRRARLFLLGAAAVSVLLVYGPELFMIRDSSGTRANSTFKLWYSSWSLLSVVAAAGGPLALIEMGGSRSVWLVRPLAAGLSLAVLAAALVFPLYASFSRTNGFTGRRTLDGLASLRATNPDEYNAAAWLNANVPRVTTVLEAAGPSYGVPGRISSRTGLPTVVDWGFHQTQQGASGEAVARREHDVDQIYRSTDASLALPLIARYRVDYVVVGTPEIETYGPQGMQKFAGMGPAVFSSPTVTIYRTGSAPLLAATP